VWVSNLNIFLSVINGFLFTMADIAYYKVQ
jgi:hypothetical protein